MLDVDGRPTLLSKKVQQLASLVGCFQAALQFHPAACKIIVLDVDQDQSSFHGSIVTRKSRHAQGVRQFITDGLKE
jgi:hypothetical protein